jgi:molybdenum storage protein
MTTQNNGDKRHHLTSVLMRESLVDKDVIASTHTEKPIVRMLPESHVVKIGGGSIVDKGRDVLYPVVDALGELLKTEKLILSTGGGLRSRHVFSIGLDLGLSTGVLAQLAIADALGNAHILGTLLSPHGVVAIPPEIFGHLLPFFMRAAPGVIFNGDPPYSLWEHPPEIGRIPPHRTDAGTYLVAECFGSKTMTLVKDVDGLYSEDPKENPKAEFIPKISASELRERNLPSLPFDEVLIDLLDRAQLMKSFQVINGNNPDLIARAIAGEHVGSIVYAG